MQATTDLPTAATTVIPSMIPGTLCVVSLVDRRTGVPLRVNGSKLAIFTRAPALAAGELLQGRDPSIWEVKVQALDPARRR